MNREIHIGDIYMAKLHGFMSEQTGLRPVVVIQNEVGNRTSKNVVVIPLTTNLKKLEMPTHVILRKHDDRKLTMDSMALCENVECISKTGLGRFLGRLTEEEMKHLALSFLLVSSSISFLEKEELLNAYEMAKMLNAPSEVRNG